MSGFFYNLGKAFGPQVRKARWVWLSTTGTEAEAIEVEREVGQDLAREIRRQVEGNTEPAVVQLLNELGTDLSRCVANRIRTFSFEAVNSSEANAFALPGGIVFVTRQLIELCEWNRDEIAFVLGHEMGHVIRRHAIDRIIDTSAINIAAAAAPIRGAFAGWLRTVGVKAIAIAYSQDQELEADELGVRLVMAAGYDAAGAIRLMLRLAALNQAAGQTGLSHYFSSHPAMEERIRNIKRLMRK